MVGRVLTDRFWQAGISEGSKDEFYARVLEKKGTLEGLASTIRGAVRFVRETTYAIIYCMSRLDVQFYGISELPGPLANALFADAISLSSHQVISLFNLVRYLVDHCPVELREHFLPPLLATCFQQMDAKISSEWEALGQQGEVQAAGERLTEEMKTESILRQLTYAAVIMVADFLDPAKTGELANPFKSNREPAKLIRPGGPTVSDKPESNGAGFPRLRNFCLANSSIVVPLLTFCAHAIRMHDGRCCGVVLRVFRSIIPEFQGGQKPAGSTLGELTVPEGTAREIREFISTEVLKAAISSLHDPYFVDSHKDIGTLIASILVHYSALTPTPREILASLPGIRVQDVDETIQNLARQNIPSRQQRAYVLDLLKDLKGVSIHEMGKLSKSLGVGGTRASSSRKVGRSKMAQEFMTPAEAAGGDGSARKKSPDLEGVAGMFNEGH